MRKQSTTKVLIFIWVAFLSIILVNDVSAQRKKMKSSQSTFDKTTSSSEYSGTKNTFFVELLGNGLIFSANYDVRLANKFGARVGIGYVGDTGGGGGILTVPIMGNVLLGKNGKYFEIGGGVTFLSGTGEIFNTSDASTVLGTFSFMYRRQPEDGGFMWKIGLTPFIAEGIFVPYWGGVGFGYCW